MGKAVSQDISVLALVKGDERYVFLYDEENRGEVLRTLGRYASNSKLSFSWYDAAVLSQKVRHEQQESLDPVEQVEETPFPFESRFDSPMLSDWDDCF
jgi:hypothetical protein